MTWIHFKSAVTHPGLAPSLSTAPLPRAQPGARASGTPWHCLPALLIALPMVHGHGQLLPALCQLSTLTHGPSRTFPSRRGSSGRGAMLPRSTPWALLQPSHQPGWPLLAACHIATWETSLGHPPPARGQENPAQRQGQAAETQHSVTPRPGALHQQHEQEPAGCSRHRARDTGTFGAGSTFVHFCLMLKSLGAIN